ncbi:four-carbon acid sugar kinase family protein [Paraburkholderia aromaticivorans]|uniref:Hrp-dependent type III effector protein n=1 Tax=Paraburkholderia aromaticivorans TaxID=2026199 RepID=A0A248VWR7_9BURK|nr:four-carbon acid sugar kinase family protein [Paraburkholderia aromaticivorans]ASW03315.1 Hrp-dependent type III effector protein [Paraburkholderia aromaticivorans]
MSLSSILIIADDLSGAADCAIAFAGAGRNTAVTLNASRATGAAEVIAVDTDTRRMPPDEAAHRTRAAWLAQRAPGRRLYKKIDSTLRGNWAAEVAALQPLAGLAIVATAFPATGRTVREGRVFVRGVPLEDTETWKLEHAAHCADLNAMVEAAGLRTAALDVHALRGDPAGLREAIAEVARGGAQALIVDAETDADLRALAQATASMDEALFWVGSGGLARELASLSDLFDGVTDAARDEPPQPAHKRSAILILVGSLSAISEQQCVMLRERAGVGELIVPPVVLRAGEFHPEWAGWQARVGAQLSAHTDLLLRIGRDDLFDPAEGAQLSAALASLIAPFFTHLSGLIVTGGETARAMLGTAGIDSLQLLAEIEPGVAVGRPHGNPRLTVVTKAGAFGSEHALYGAYLHLRGTPEFAHSDSGSAQPSGTARSSPARETNQCHSGKTS